MYNRKFVVGGGLFRFRSRDVSAMQQRFSQLDFVRRLSVLVSKHAATTTTTTTTTISFDDMIFQLNPVD